MSISGQNNSTERNERLEAEHLSDALPPLLLRANQLVKEFSPGVHGRRQAGAGEDFWQFQQYSTENAASEIDWRQSAKRDQLFIRQKELETVESVWFWHDNSPTMHYRSEGAHYSKLSHATILALATGLLLSKGGENFGLLGVSKRAAHGPVAFDHFARDLVHHRESDPLSDIRHFGLSRNTRIVLISDFLRPLDQVEKTIRYFSNNGCRGILVHMADPAEVELPFNGRVKFEGLENGDTITIGRTEAIRGDYKTLFENHKSSINSLARDMSWDYIFSRTDASLGDTLAGLYHALQWGD